LLCCVLFHVRQASSSWAEHQYFVMQGANGAVQKPPASVGPNVQGTEEEYQLEKKLQTALFGAVYQAKGLSSGRPVAVKVLHKAELRKISKNTSIEFCETPLSEVEFRPYMQGCEHVLSVNDVFEDDFCHYVVFDLAHGGDLLEALKKKPRGFSEVEAQYFLRQAILGLHHLHDQNVALQDVSLENLLLFVAPSGAFQVKVCDPGQASIFSRLDGKELPCNFRGLVGKSFRAPELYEHRPYYATKVDSWCVGWSTFYLLTAQSLFQSADPKELDPDWNLFAKSDFQKLFRQKDVRLSATCVDFILKLLRRDPSERMSLSEALDHQWLSSCNQPVQAPRDLREIALRPRPPRSQPLPPTPIHEQASNAQDSSAVKPSTASSGLPLTKLSIPVPEYPNMPRPLYPARSSSTDITRSDVVSPTPPARGRAGYYSRIGGDRCIVAQSPASRSPSPTSIATVLAGRQTPRTPNWSTSGPRRTSDLARTPIIAARRGPVSPGPSAIRRAGSPAPELIRARSPSPAVEGGWRWPATVDDRQEQMRPAVAWSARQTHYWPVPNQSPAGPTRAVSPTSTTFRPWQLRPTSPVARQIPIPERRMSPSPQRTFFAIGGGGQYPSTLNSARGRSLTRLAGVQASTPFAWPREGATASVRY